MDFFTDDFFLFDEITTSEFQNHLCYLWFTEHF